jgi:hypothetical protein
MGDNSIEMGADGGAVAAYFVENLLPANDAQLGLELLLAGPIGKGVTLGTRFVVRKVDDLAAAGSRLARVLNTNVERLVNPGRWFDGVFDNIVVGVGDDLASVGGRSVTPADYGLAAIVDNPEWLSIYDATLGQLAAGDNAYAGYLRVLGGGQQPTKAQINAAWKSVGSAFSVNMRAAGHEIQVTHHWNWTKELYSDYVFDPRNLYPISSARPMSLHGDIHRALTSHPEPNAFFMNKFIGPIQRRHALELGAPRSVLPPWGE